MAGAAEALEGLEEEAGDVVRLEAAGLGALHVFADAADGRRVHAVAGERALVEEVAAALAVDDVVDDLLEPGPDLGLVAVADRLDEQLAQRLVAEELAQDVEDAAAEGLALLFELLEQALETSPSRVSSATRFQRWQTSVWPMRWMRPKRCSIRFGFQGRS